MLSYTASASQLSLAPHTSSRFGPSITCRAAPTSHFRSTRRPGGRCQATEIEDLDSTTEEFCDDFQCTSGPALRETVQSLSRCIKRGAWEPAKFAPSVVYKDGLRRSSGREAYTDGRNNYVKYNIEDLSVSIDGIKMLDLGRAQICWSLSGKLSGLTVSATVTSVFDMNPLTGLVEAHTDSWEATCGAPAQAALSASRAGWAIKQGSVDAGKAANEVLESLSSMDEPDYDIKDAADPTKFFGGQQPPQGGNDYTEMLQYATVIALLYAVYQGFAVIEGIK